MKKKKTLLILLCAALIIVSVFSLSACNAGKKAQQTVDDAVNWGIAQITETDVTSNLTLPAQYKKGNKTVKLAWTSDETDIIAPSGEFTAPDTDTDVILTCKAEYNNKKAQKNITVTAKAETLMNKPFNLGLPFDGNNAALLNGDYLPPAPFNGNESYTGSDMNRNGGYTDMNASQNGNPGTNTYQNGYADANTNRRNYGNSDANMNRRGGARSNRAYSGRGNGRYYDGNTANGNGKSGADNAGYDAYAGDYTDNYTTGRTDNSDNSDSRQGKAERLPFKGGNRAKQTRARQNRGGMPGVGNTDTALSGGMYVWERV
ncbi:MAG: hypothetical protein LBP79_00040 [Clostridiales bacterium]|jgi:hypothetical protein|nr:hypothetical protein [Clostridiales bacterium]